MRGARTGSASPPRHEGSGPSRPTSTCSARLATSGFDWVTIDAQHGPVDRTTLHALGRALGGAGAAFVVRVPGVDPAWIGAALDAGAAAVIVPSVTGAADAVAAARQPLSTRGGPQLGAVRPALGCIRP